MVNISATLLAMGVPVATIAENRPLSALSARVLPQAAYDELAAVSHPPASLRG